MLFYVFMFLCAWLLTEGLESSGGMHTSTHQAHCFDSHKLKKALEPKRLKFIVFVTIKFAHL